MINLLLRIFSIQCLFGFCLMAQSLPEGWWLQGSPEAILTNAQTRTLQLSYFWGEKMHNLIDKNASFEIFQRKTTDGKSETKFTSTLLVRGQPLQFVNYSLESGQYFYTRGLLTKLDFESIDDIIQRVSTNFDRPYEYQMLKPEMIGTNECIVVARTMAAPMANAVLDEKYNLTPEKKRVMSKDAVGISTEAIRDYYIRKSDGIILGYVIRNSSGTLVDDQLCDAIQINFPIPKEEFLLPGGTAIVAHSWNEWTPLMNKSVKKSVSTILVKTTPEERKRHIIAITLMIVPSVLFLIAAFKFRKQFWHKSARS